MNKLNINLLPIEMEQSKKSAKRKALVIRLSVIFLIVMIGLTSLVMVVAITQNFALRLEESKLKQSKDQITAMQEKEGLLFILRNRLDGINNINSRPSPAASAYNLLTSLVPPGVSMLSFSVGKNANVSISGETSSVVALNNFFTNLSDPAKHEGKIGNTKIENLGRGGATDRIRFDLGVNITGK